MEYESLKSEIMQISEIAAAVPESFRERCFELLVQHLLAEVTRDERVPDLRPEDDQRLAPSEHPPAVERGGDAIPLQAQMRVFLAKTGITPDELGRVVMFDGEHVHFIREPSATVIAAGQIEWALLLALKNGIEANKLEVDPEAVRSICQEKGYYDKKNFASNFKKAKSASYFKGPLEPQGAVQGLTNDGVDALGKLVRSLAGAE